MNRSPFHWVPSRRLVSLVTLVWALLVTAASVAKAADPQLPENLAVTAQASATSEHNQAYRAKFAIDGRIPAKGSRQEDLNAAWCVLKRKTGDAADFVLQWPRPIRIAEVAYFGRTSWYLEENFKRFEVYLDDAAEPVASGCLEMVHGPQRISVAPAIAQRLTIRFLDSYGGPNPGAAELMVFAERLTTKQFAQLQKTAGSTESAVVGGPDPEAIAALIRRLRRTYGDRYSRADQHLTRLEQLLQDEVPESDARWNELQRECCCSTSTGCW